MKIDDDGNITQFCCDEFDRATLQPNKRISIDLQWKDHFLDKPHPRACWLKKKSGVAMQENGMVSDAGFMLEPMEVCPFCGAQIKFEEQV